MCHLSGSLRRQGLWGLCVGDLVGPYGVPHSVTLCLTFRGSCMSTCILGVSLSLDVCEYGSVYGVIWGVRGDVCVRGSGAMTAGVSWAHQPCFCAFSWPVPSRVGGGDML